MGGMSARDMVGHVDRETLVRWHLQHNHYPPVPDDMVPVAVKALEAIQSGREHQWFASIPLPVGVRYKGRTWATAEEMAEAFHLDDLVDEEG